VTVSGRYRATTCRPTARRTWWSLASVHARFDGGGRLARRCRSPPEPRMNRKPETTKDASRSAASRRSILRLPSRNGSVTSRRPGWTWKFPTLRGAKSLQALIGGSADVVTGSFDHTIQMQAKNQSITALVQLGRFPGFALALRGQGRQLHRPEGPQGHENRRQTAPGSSTHFMVLYMMTQAGLKPEDASFIGTGSGGTVVRPCSMARSTVSRMPIRWSQSSIATASSRSWRIPARWKEPPRSMAAVSGRRSLRADGFHREESQHRAGAGQCFRARTEMGQGAQRRGNRQMMPEEYAWATRPCSCRRSPRTTTPIRPTAALPRKPPRPPTRCSRVRYQRCGCENRSRQDVH